MTLIHALFVSNHQLIVQLFSCAKKWEDSDREEVVFQCRHAFLPSVNPLVSLVRIRSEKSLICLQSPQGFIGGEIQLLYCFRLNLTLLFIYFYCSPRLIYALSYAVTVIFINLDIFLLRDVGEKMSHFDWLSFFMWVCVWILATSFRPGLEKVRIKNKCCFFITDSWSNGPHFCLGVYIFFLCKNIYVEAFEHFPLKNILRIPIWIVKYTAKTERSHWSLKPEAMWDTP